MSSKKILLATTNGVNNYGAALQAYALKRELGFLGEVSTLNYVNRHIGSSMDVVRLKPSLHGLLGTAKDLCRIRPRKCAIHKFHAFQQKYLNLTAPMTRLDLTSDGINPFDLYVSGSDQIWNPKCVSATGRIDRTYFFDFLSKNSRRVSFASSIGGFIPSPTEIEEMKTLLNEYQQISVREKDTQEMLEKLLNREVYHALDPTLLLSGDEWSAFPDTKVLGRIPDKYLLMYSVPKLPFVLETVKHLASRFGLKIVAIEQDPFLKIRPDLHIKDAGPEDFLTLFRNAAFVVTDSFHGTCFSINFGIPFCVTSAGEHSNRIVSLLDLTQLGSRLVSTTEQVLALDQEIDFSVAPAALKQRRVNDHRYLALLD